MAVIFIFIDGVGLGHPGEENPFFVNTYESFEFLTGGTFDNTAKPFISQNHVFKPIDANLDIEGLPQSGTGQTTLFSGVNASKIIDKHFGPYPHSKIKYLLKEHSLFHDLIKAGKKPYFINAYPPIFFDKSQARNRWSCTTLMVKNSGMKLNSTEDILKERALTAEITQNIWRERLGIDIPKISPKKAAERLLQVVSDYDLVLYEYYLTDKAGHKMDHDKAKKILTVLDDFISHIISHKKKKDLLFITSDHGNIEDLSTKSHTRNKVPIFALGNGAEQLATIESLVDVKRAITNYLTL